MWFFSVNNHCNFAVVIIMSFPMVKQSRCNGRKRKQICPHCVCQRFTNLDPIILLVLTFSSQLFFFSFCLSHSSKCYVIKLLQSELWIDKVKVKKYQHYNNYIFSTIIFYSIRMYYSVKVCMFECLLPSSATTTDWFEILQLISSNLSWKYYPWFPRNFVDLAIC